MKAVFQLEIINFNFLHAADTNEDGFVCLAALRSRSLITQTVLCADWYVFGSSRVLNRTKLRCVIFPFHIRKMFGLDTEIHMSESSFKFGC